MCEPKLRIHRFIGKTAAEGPGDRACIWVQGCPIRCRGCYVPWTWSENGGEIVDVGQIEEWILEQEGIEGVTFLGGEPFEQAEPLTELAKRVKQHGLSVMSFTGYELAFIRRSSRQDWHDLLAQLDLLIDGPFIQEKLDTSRPWVGSSNQQYHFLTDRYQHLEPQLTRFPNRLEIRIKRDGTIGVNGLATVDQLEELIDPFLYQTHRLDRHNRGEK